MKFLLIWAFLLPLLANDSLELGEIEVNAKERTITFPAKINQDGEIAEFLLVHKNGKVHEALWSTEVTAVELATAMALFEFEVDKENVKDVPKTVENVGELPEMKVFVSTDKEEWIPATKFIGYKGKGEALDEHPWHYRGSYFWNDKFMAQVEGDLIAIYTNVNALFLMEHTERLDDTLWFSNTNELGKQNDPVFLKIVLPIQKK